jgi:hypothetical protein
MDIPAIQGNVALSQEPRFRLEGLATASAKVRSERFNAYRLLRKTARVVTTSAESLLLGILPTQTLSPVNVVWQVPNPRAPKCTVLQTVSP